MSHLLNTPSTGQSEVLETLHFYGAARRAITVKRLARLVSNRYHGDDSRNADSQFETDLITVVNALQGLGYVTATVAAVTDTVRLTAAGRVAGRHTRPRTRRIPA